MEQLSFIDSMFLYVEDNRMPMHIGSIYFLAAADPQKEFDLESFKEFWANRLHLTKVYRRRLLETPLNIGRPYWVDDPDFNIDNHITHIQLPKGSTRENFLKLAAQVYNRPLDRSRPLWSYTIITGLDGIPTVPKNSFALIAKIHHACIDGISGIEIQKTIFDTSPIPRDVPKPEEEWNPKPLTFLPPLIAQDYAKRATTFPKRLFNFYSSSTKSFANLLEKGITPKELIEEFLKPSAPLTPFNQRVKGRKAFGMINIPIKEIKTIKDKASVKVNDVMLAICGGGLRKYLINKKALPQKSLIAGVPVSLRKEEQKKSMGNQISVMRIGLGTDEQNPAHRLKKINKHTQNSKIIARAASVDAINELIPSEVAAIASKLYARIGVLSKYALSHNVVITNVPGPSFPIYMNGYKMLYHYGLGITMENMGLMITIFSMADTFTITLTSEKSMVPNPQKLADYIKDALQELTQELASKQEESDLFKVLGNRFDISEREMSLL